MSPFVDAYVEKLLAENAHLREQLAQVREWAETEPENWLRAEVLATLDEERHFYRPHHLLAECAICGEGPESHRSILDQPENKP